MPLAFQSHIKTEKAVLRRELASMKSWSVQRTKYIPFLVLDAARGESRSCQAPGEHLICARHFEWWQPTRSMHPRYILHVLWLNPKILTDGPIYQAWAVSCQATPSRGDIYWTKLHIVPGHKFGKRLVWWWSYSRKPLSPAVHPFGTFGLLQPWDVSCNCLDSSLICYCTVLFSQFQMQWKMQRASVMARCRYGNDASSNTAADKGSCEASLSRRYFLACAFYPHYLTCTRCTSMTSVNGKVGVVAMCFIFRVAVYSTWSFHVLSLSAASLVFLPNEHVD